MTSCFVFFQNGACVQEIELVGIAMSAEVIPAKDLPEKVQRHMESLAGQFSAETLDVEITSKCG